MEDLLEMTLKVLIIDDSDIVLFLHQEILSDSQFTTNPLTALNGQVALDILLDQAEPDTHYLLLLDINMPVMDGWMLLDSLQKHPNLPTYSVIMVTSSIDTQDKRKAKNYPNVIGFFEKPLSGQNCFEMTQMPALKRFFDSSK